MAQYLDKVVTDPTVIEIRDKINATSNDKLKADETDLSVTFSNGKKIGKHIFHAIGSLEVPMTDAQLTEKFVDQSALVLGDDGATINIKNTRELVMNFITHNIYL